MITFSEIAERYLNQMGYEAYHCSSEEESRERVVELIDKSNGLAISLKAIQLERKTSKNFTLLKKI